MNKVNFKDISNFHSILELGTRTVQKIIERMGLGCSLCGWNEASCDIHHIIDVSLGGSNDLNNLILVCPNHHRIIHKKRDLDEKYSNENLTNYSLEYTHKDWKNYYNVYNKKNFSREKIYLDKCSRDGCTNNVNHKSAKFCSRKCGKFNSIEFIDKNNLVNLLIENNFNLSRVGKILNFSDNSIKKYCKINDIEIIRVKRNRVICNKIIKLSQDDIKYIIDNYKERDKYFGCRGLGRKFRVHHTTIMDVLHKYKNSV